MSLDETKILKLCKWLESSGFSDEANSINVFLSKKSSLADALRIDNSSSVIENLPPTIQNLPENLNQINPNVNGGASTEEVRQLFPNESQQRLEELRELYNDSANSITSTLGSLREKITNGVLVLRANDSFNKDPEFIKEIQKKLEEKGYDIGSAGITGLFQAPMEAALIRFQARNLLPTNGALDSATLSKIYNDSSVSETQDVKEKSNDSNEVLTKAVTPSDNTGYPEITLAARNIPQNIPQRSRPESEVIFPKFSFVEVPCTNCAAMAIQESKDNWDNGNRAESHPEAEATLMEYWRYASRYNSWSRNIDRWGFEGRRTYGPKKGKHQMNPVKTRDENGVATDWMAWSAVFTSFIMGHHDGEGAKWFVSEAHSPYIASYKKKRREIERRPEEHIGKMYYLWFTRDELNRYGMQLEPGDLVGRPQHCDIYIGNNQMIGGNTCAQSEFTGGKRKNCKGTSGPQPVRWRSGTGVIKRVKITGVGSSRTAIA